MRYNIKFTNIGLIIGVSLIPISFYLALISNSLDISIDSFKVIQNDTSIWIIELLPIIFLIIGRFIDVKIAQIRKTLLTKLELQNDNNNRVVSFADQIGNGELDAEYKLIDENDRLGITLISMRDKLIENFKKESKLSWIAQGRDQISNVLRLHNDLKVLSYEVLVHLIKYIDVIQGAFYIKEDDSDYLNMEASYAYNRRKYLNTRFKIGEGLVGESAIERQIIYRTEIPDDFVTITSGILGDKKPKSLLIVPLITEEHLMGAVEFASLEEIPQTTIEFIQELSDIIARTIYNLKLNQKTERLLRESQTMTEELKRNEDQLRHNALEMRATQEELKETNAKLEVQFQEVENSQKRLHSLLENASEVIGIYDENIKLFYESPSCNKILGYTEQELIDGKDFDRLTPKGQVDFREMFEKLLANPEEPVTIQYTYMRQDNVKIYLETTGRNLLHDPAIQGIILNSSDITERKRAEKEERMKSKMQALSENSIDCIIRLDTRGRFYYANPMVKNYTGVPSEEFFRKTLEELPLPAEYVEKWGDLVKEMKREKVKLLKEMSYTDMNGEERIVEVNAIPEFSEEGKLETILVVSHDITEQKIIEMEIKEKNKKISDSINYAKRIQNAILPDNKLIRNAFEDSFMLYKPKDVVSGDFPWFYEKGDDIYIAAVDCTGHGVPGALLSLIGYFTLNYVVGHEESYNAGEVLNLLHEGVKKTLRQEEEGAEARDGMDVALCKINKKTMTLEYAGAHRPLYYLKSDGTLEQIKGSPKAIGGIPKPGKPDNPFENHILQIKTGEAVFFNSDGFPDQFGGPDNRKYGPKKIRDNIESNPDMSMARFDKLFNKEFETWKGDEKQFDDILLIGIRF